ncbi:Protein CBR-SPAT-2 [Caenorhabditis briggsae]|uniref:Protein CBR-SPAT-2 n=1 Tax=Caenorhabditis briggsae TaxID=6238 RepID=A8XH76_CAEBR|nr:Protein CBR-SPAT-2 [Caenorhabditis briggsae]CAP32000.2 Protein CBR-SPAT-2 [Caenorhabditis briggsae]
MAPSTSVLPSQDSLGFEQPLARMKNNAPSKSNYLKHFLSAKNLGFSQKLNLCKIVGLSPWSIFSNEIGHSFFSVLETGIACTMCLFVSASPFQFGSILSFSMSTTTPPPPRARCLPHFRIDSVGDGEPYASGAPGGSSEGVNAPEEPPKNQLDNGRKTAGGKNKKNGKNVSSEYTVEANAKNSKKSGNDSDEMCDIGTKGVGSHSLVEILKELGLEVSDLVESKKKNKKGNNGGKKNKQQEKKQASPKETARSPPSDNETIPTDDGADKIKKPVQPTKKKMDEVAVAASITKRCSSGVGQSEEDDDQSYVSAQENLGGSTSRLSTPPAEFVDARQSRDDIIDNVMLDPNNYRDDEDVESLAKQLQQQEDEFITVGKNKKKNKKQSSIPENVSASSTASSSSPPNRRNTHPDARVNTTPSVTSSNNQQHHQRGNNRTAAHPTTLGDFMESTKKDTHKNIKHKKVMSPISTISQKKQMSIEDPTPSSPAFVDALETPISVNTVSLDESCDLEDAIVVIRHFTSTFSYADAAKKSSGENTPAQEMSPVPTSGSTNTATINQSAPAAHQNSQDLKQKASESSYAASKGISTAVSSAVQLPASSAAVADSDISFGYEETPEDKQLRREQKESSVVIEQNVPIKPLDFMNQFRDMKVSVMPAEGKSENNIIDDQIMKVWKARWDDFQTKGAKPIMYNPSQKK